MTLRLALQRGTDEMSYEPILRVLGLFVIVSPLVLMVVLGLSSLVGSKLTENRSSNLVYATIVSGLLAATLVLVLMLVSGTRHVAVHEGNWVAIPRFYHFSVKFVFDRCTPSWPAASRPISSRALAFASLLQVGIIVAEIGLGFRYLALVHMLGHACLRTLQFLRAPSLLLDYRMLEDAVGQHLPRSTS